MKRKLLSLLLCAAMFIGVLPAVSFADSTTSAGAKLGVENGDFVPCARKRQLQYFLITHMQMRKQVILCLYRPAQQVKTPSSFVRQ